jgi:hypothetical protein
MPTKSEWFNMHPADLPAALKKDYDAIHRAEDKFTEALLAQLQKKGLVPKDKFIAVSVRRGRDIGYTVKNTQGDASGSHYVKL